MSTRVVILCILALVAGLIIGFMIPAHAAAPAVHRTQHHCTYRPGTVLCVRRAPKDVCKAAFGHDFSRACWRFTGGDSQLVFDWRGRVRTS